MDFEVGEGEELFNMGFPQGSNREELLSGPSSDSSKSLPSSPSPRADQLRAKGERPSVRKELADIAAYLKTKTDGQQVRLPKMPVKINRKDKVL